MCVNDLFHFCADKDSHFQNERKCKSLLVKTSFNSMRIKKKIPVDGFALSLALKQRLSATRRRPEPIYMPVDYVFELRFSAGTIYPISMMFGIGNNEWWNFNNMLFSFSCTKSVNNFKILRQIFSLISTTFS